MEEKILREMASTLKDIQGKLSIGSASGLRGPVADPGPEWEMFHPELSRPWLLRGPVADPAPWYLLDKAKLAQLKIHQLDAAIMELEKQIDSFKLERDLLKQEYKLK